MNNAEASTREEIKNALLTGEGVNSGYDVRYTFQDVFEECKNFTASALCIATTAEDKILLHAQLLREELNLAADRVAIEIEESFHE